MKERTKKEKFSLVIMILLFSVISFYTSYTGLLKLSGVSEYNYILKAFMAILVGGLQFALVFSINAFYIKDLFKKDWLKSIALLIIYLITMTLSVTFSFSYWYEAFSAEDYATRSAKLQLNQLKDSLVSAKNSFASMEYSLTKLSNYSETASNRERIYGRTCNATVGAGEGPFTWLRADDAKYTKNYSEDIKKLRTELDSEIAEVSNYLETFDPKGDVIAFNRVVNNRIKSINIKFFNNQTLNALEGMLLQRRGNNRKHITVLSRKTGNSSVESCMDRDFTIGANRVIKRIHSLQSIETLHFFDMSDSKKLFGRTVGVLKSLLDPSYTIKITEEMSSPEDITYDDIGAVTAGFVIDFIILLFSLYAKEPKEDLIPQEVVMDIINGRHPNEVLSSLRVFLAEMNKFYLIAIPNDVDDEHIENIKLLMLYMQQHKLAKLYVNERKANRLNRYFRQSLRESYPNSTFRLYKLNKKKFITFILQNIEAGVRNV
jgi:hypothetical protein